MKTIIRPISQSTAVPIPEQPTIKNKKKRELSDKTNNKQPKNKKQKTMDDPPELMELVRKIADKMLERQKNGNNDNTIDPVIGNVGKNHQRLAENTAKLRQFLENKKKLPSKRYTMVLCKCGFPKVGQIIAHLAYQINSTVKLIPTFLF